MKLSLFSEAIQDGVRYYIDNMLLCGDLEFCESIETHERNVAIKQYTLNYSNKTFDYFELHCNYDVIAKYIDGVFIDFDTPDCNESPITYEYINSLRSMFLDFVRGRTNYNGTVMRYEYY